MNKLPEFARERMRQQMAGDHPEADLLAAFAEQALRGEERERVLAHLAACHACREVVALAAPEVLPHPASAPEAPATWLGWSLWRWASVGAAAVIVGSAVTSSFLLRSRMPAPTPAQVVAMQPAKPDDARAANEALPSEARGRAALEKKATAPAATDKWAAKDMAVGRQAPQLVVPPLREQKRPAAAPGIVTPPNVASGRTVGGAVATPAAAPPPPPAQPRADAEPVQVTDSAVSPRKAESATAAKLQRAPVPARGGPSQVQVQQQAAPMPQATVAEAQANAIVARKEKGLAGGTTVMFKSALAAPVRWRVSDTGSLERLTPEGWEPAPVAAGVTFRVVSVVGPEVWAGGNAGALFHSNDGGERWQRVRPRAGDAELSADITRIEFTDGVHGKINTANGETWTTADAGRTWTRE